MASKHALTHKGCLTCRSYDHNLGYLDRGAGELFELRGPGLLTWCGQWDCFTTNETEAHYDKFTYSPYFSVVGPTPDRANHTLYYIKCVGPLCARRDPATGACADTTTQLCGEYALLRYNWETEVEETLWRADPHIFPGPDIFAQHLMQIAFDPVNQFVYWFTRYR